MKPRSADRQALPGEPTGQRGDTQSLVSWVRPYGQHRKLTVIAVAGRAHGQPNARLAAPIPWSHRHRLASPVAMVTDVPGAPLAHGRRHRVQHRFGQSMARYRPTDDLAAPVVRHDGEIKRLAAVGASGISHTQSWSDRDAVKLRSTRSGTGWASLIAPVVTGPPRRWLDPTRPATCISRPIPLGPYFSPCVRKPACTRGAPPVLRERAYMVRTRLSSAASATACQDGGRCPRAKKPALDTPPRAPRWRPESRPGLRS